MPLLLIPDTPESSGESRLEAVSKRLERANQYEKALLKILDAVTIARALGVFNSNAPTPALVCLRAIDAEIETLKASRG